MKEAKEVIAGGASRAILLRRLVVLFVLVASAITVSLLVRKFIADEQQEDFESQFFFDSDSIKLFDAIGERMDAVFSANDALVTKLVSYAHYSNSLCLLSPCQALLSRP